MQNNELMVSASLDSELVDLLNGALLYVSEDELKNYIRAVWRFNVRIPSLADMITRGLEGEKEIQYWDAIRKDLRLFPGYFTAAKRINLLHEESFGLLLAMANVQKKRSLSADLFQISDIAELIKLMTGSFDACAEREIGFTNLHVLQMKERLNPANFDRGTAEISRFLETIQKSLAAGLSVDQSFSIVDIARHNTRLIKHGADDEFALYDELKENMSLLATHNVAGGLMYEVLLAAIKTDQLHNLVNALHGSVCAPQSQEEVMRMIAAAGSVGEDKTNEVLNALIRKGFSKEPAAQKSPNDYFPDIGISRVIQGVLPYRIKKSWAGGIGDLIKTIVGAYDEGAYIFDPKCIIWYSLGGRTYNCDDGQKFFPYDVSQLSKTPVYVHVHSEQYELSMPGGNFFHLWKKAGKAFEAQDLCRKFLSALPSQADFEKLAGLIEASKQRTNLSLSIVSTSGLVSVNCPSDAAQVRAYAKEFDVQKDSVMQNFDMRSYLDGNQNKEAPETFVAKRIEELNARLPEGLGIEIQPFDNLSTRNNNIQQAAEIKKLNY